MEQNQDSSLFGLSIDPAGKNHLSEAARWAKFLAIVGIVVCAIIVLIGIFAGSIFSSMAGSTRYNRFEGDAEITRGVGTAVTVVYIIIAVLCFFPYLFLLHFANKMKTALLSNDQDSLNASFQNLKKTFRYVGVLTIIGLVFWLISIVVVLGSSAGRL